MKKASKASVLAAVLGASAIALSACGGGSGDQSSSDRASGGTSGGKTSILAWHGYTEADGKVLDKIVENFNSSQDKCEVKAEPIAWSSITEKLMTSLGAGNGPNIVVQGVDTGRGYVKQGGFVSLQDFYDDPQYDSSEALYPNMVEEVQWDGETYAVPMGTAAYSIFVNTDLWQKAGLTEADYPTTFEELIDVAKKATISNGSGEPESYGIAAPDKDAAFVSLLAHAGDGGYITDGVADLNSDANVSTFEKWQSVVMEDKITPTAMDATAAMDLFGAGRAAMIVNGPWEITSADSFGVPIDVTSWPGDWTLGVLNYWFATSVNKTDAEMECSLQFMNFWNSVESQTIWTESYYPPNRADVPEADFADPLVAKINEASDRAHYYATGIEGNYNDINDTVIAMMQQITTGGDVKSLLEETQNKLEGYLQK